MILKILLFFLITAMVHTSAYAEKDLYSRVLGVDLGTTSVLCSGDESLCTESVDFSATAGIMQDTNWSRPWEYYLITYGSLAVISAALLQDRDASMFLIPIAVFTAFDLIVVPILSWTTEYIYFGLEVDYSLATEKNPREGYLDSLKGLEFGFFPFRDLDLGLFLRSGGGSRFSPIQKALYSGVGIGYFPVKSSGLSFQLYRDTIEVLSEEDNPHYNRFSFSMGYKFHF